ncbi:MAG: NAD+ synthase, partial [Candidatus Marinimicrobia bacterium]|nr:NAD+ synthase [Candidatus Neomarinimicrobiota bacterium]
MSKILRIGMAQINPVLGDLEGNSGKIIGLIKDAAEKGVDLIIFPELAITGYPPQDLIFNNNFVDENIKALNKIAANS